MKRFAAPLEDIIRDYLSLSVDDSRQMYAKVLPQLIPRLCTGGFKSPEIERDCLIGEKIV